MLEKLLARLEAFLNGAFVPKADLEAATAKLAEVSERNAQLEAQLKQANEGRISESNLLTAANQSVAALTVERDGLKSEVEKLKSDATTLDAAAAAKAREICAAQGIPAAKIQDSEASPISKSGELEQTREALANEKDPKKRAELSRKCRELRGHSDLFSEPKK